MLNDFIELFLGAYHNFIPEDFVDKEWFDSIIVCIAEGGAIVGALIFGAVTINAMFSVFKSR